MSLPKTELCIWRDALDAEQICIGSVTKVHTALGTRRRFTAWLTCHIDALLFLADKQIYDQVRDADARDLPLPLTLDLHIPER